MLFWLRDVRKPYTNPTYYFDNGLDPSTYMSVPYAPAETRLRAFIEYANGIPRARRADPRQPAHAVAADFVDYGVAGFGGFAEFYRKECRSLSRR